MSTELLVPLDGSPLADDALPHAVALARRLGAGLRLVRVIVPAAASASPPEAPFFLPDPAWDESRREVARAWLAKRAREVRDSHGVATTFDLCEGAPVDEISRLAADRRVRAIVCSTHGLGGWAPHWLGSVADGLIRHAPCPVLAMSEAAVKREARVKRLLVLLDGSAVSDAILPHAAWVARAFGADLELLRVVAPAWVGDSLMPLRASEADAFGLDAFADAAKLALDRVASALRKKGLTAATLVQVDFSPARAILEHVQRTDPDMIALATHGRGLSRLFLGSIADKVLRAGARPTLLVRPGQPGAVAPEAEDAASLERVTASAGT